MAKGEGGEGEKEEEREKEIDGRKDTEGVVGRR